VFAAGCARSVWAILDVLQVYSGADRGLFPTTHVAAIRRRKKPCSRGPLSLPTSKRSHRADATQIGLILCA